MPKSPAAGPSSLQKDAVPVILIRRYLVVGVLCLITMFYFRSHLLPINNHPHCGHLKELEGRKRIWTVPLERNDDQGFYGITYSTNFSLGCPPQRLIARVDIGSSTLQIPSSICSSECPPDPKYRSSTSWSYRRNGTHWTWNSGMIVRAVESVDILTFEGGLEVASQHFWELYDFDSNPDSLYRRSESMLKRMVLTEHLDKEGPHRESSFGLAVGGPHRQHGTLRRENHSPFQTMVEEGVLEKNIFALSLLKGAQDAGNLMFGGYDNAAFEGDLVHHAIFPPHTNSWSIEASSIYMTTSNESGSPQVLLNESTAGYQALLSTSISHISVPEPLFSHIIAQLNSTEGAANEHVVDCDNIDRLPVITIVLGDQEISLLGRDYVRRKPTPPSHKDLVECVPEFHRQYTPTTNIEGPKGAGVDAENHLELGTAFLQKVYSVFDYDTRTISCMYSLLSIQLPYIESNVQNANIACSWDASAMILNELLVRLPWLVLTS